MSESFPSSSEQFESQESVERIKQMVISASGRAFEVHEALGAKGEEKVEKNRFGDTALLADIEAERAVIDYLREVQLPMRVISEEHGVTDLSEHPRYLAVLDGLDGSSVYKKARGVGRYGTMFSILKGLDPTYADYMSGGIMEHSTRRLFVASKGGGAFVIQEGKPSPIRASGKTTLDGETRIYIDEGFDVNKKAYSEKLSEYHYSYLGSSAVYYADIASGAADLVLECTRKGNLEIAVAYGLEREAGAVMVDKEGKDIGTERYLSFAQKEMVPIITAATPELAEAVIAHLRAKEK